METLLKLYLPFLLRFNADPVPQAPEHEPGEQSQSSEAADGARLVRPRPILIPIAAPGLLF